MPDSQPPVATSPNGKPLYRDRFPCPNCGAGYLDCVSYASLGLMCCRSCSHPGRFDTPEPYSKEEIEDMHRRANR